MAKNSDTLHRVAATFQGGRDPDQDAVIQWLGTLPKDEKGQLRRSVLKYHLQRALLHYMHSGLANSQSVGVVPAGQPAPAPAPAQRPAQTATPVVAPAPAAVAPSASIAHQPTVMSTVDHDSIPTLTETLSPAAPISVAPPAEGKKSGGLLRSRIKNSMGPGTGE